MAPRPPAASSPPATPRLNDDAIVSADTEKRILRYVFPGSELDHIGHSLEAMEAEGFEVHDVEGWRAHYALTCRHWHRRLADRRDEAVARVGAEKVRLWLAYLAGVALAFEDGSLRIYPTVATKQRAKGPSGMPPTRAALDREEPAAARAPGAAA